MSENLVPASAQPWRTAITCAVFAALFGLLAYRLHHLQVEQAGHFSDLGERQRSRVWRIKASRGEVLDARGNPLVVSGGMWNLYADPGYMNDKLATMVALERILGAGRDELRDEFTAKGNGRLIAENVSDEQATALRTWMDLYREEHHGRYLEGLTLRRSYQRKYVHGDMAQHILGFVLDDGTGGAGIEQACDQYLRGHDGRETLSVDARGRPLISSSGERLAARQGADVQLTIEVAIQHELQEALLEAVTKHKAAGAAGIVVRPATGQIVAMASWPTFSLTDFGSADPASFRNNALAFVYESGSTMKPLVAGAAVADGVAGWDTVIDCENGSWTYRHGRSKRTIHSHPHGRLTVLQGIAKSDNILMAKLGIELGPERLYDWIHRFGFGRATGLELPGEDAGIVLPRKRWNLLGSCMSVPMGHELAVTPLQMAMAHAAIANDGVWQPPRIIKRIYMREGDGAETDLNVPLLRPDPRRVFSKANADAIERAMMETMTTGTGKRSQLEGWTSAGKTGTTEKLVNGKYSKESHIGSFVAWAPAGHDVRPKYLCLVVVDDPRANGHYGSQTGAPVVKRVLQFALDNEPGARPDLDQAPDAEGAP
ncbi:MAG: penicillin-binding protein 2 [Planctomycetota bacterium]|jgi:cell division protein FtsI/penicillin-binding protein 2|nr:penicillin-binding protein 2 [Planctomycetota bacterium]